MYDTPIRPHALREGEVPRAVDLRDVVDPMKRREIRGDIRLVLPCDDPCDLLRSFSKEVCQAFGPASSPPIAVCWMRCAIC